MGNSSRRLCKTRGFTLLEIMLVVILLALMASVVGWQLGKCVMRYSFQQEIERFFLTLKEAQLLSLTYQTDIHLHLLQEKGSFFYYLESDEPFLKIGFDRGKKKLKNVKRVTWQNRPIKKIDLFLNAHGSVKPRGTLAFSSKKDEEESPLWIDLQGAFLLTLSEKKPPELKERKPAFPHGL
jgi:prepilin-type N-terminal cleavage/methylation domain-containing protein